MKLELKHLAPYLPYRLELIFLKSGRRITMLSCFFDSDTLHVVDKNEGNEYPLSIWDFKPILRPLSDLTEAIEVNGDSFIPIDKILSERECDAEFDFISALEDDWASADSKMAFAPYSIIQKFFEWHFDVFGLIESGLAVKK